MGLALAHEVNINHLQLLHAMLHNNPFASHDENFVNKPNLRTDKVSLCS
jgi:hypothetical protein